MRLRGFLTLWKSIPTIVLFFISALFVDFVFLACFYAFPNYRIQFTKENLFLEDLTAFLFFCTFLVTGGWLIFSHKKNHRGLLAVIAITGLLSSLDELQYIDPVIHFFAPDFGKVRFDAIHDLVGYVVKFFFRSARREKIEPFIVTGVGLAILIILMVIFWKYLKRPLVRLITSPPFHFFLVIIVLLFVSTRIDMGAFPRLINPRLWEEIVEFDGALALLFCFFSVLRMKNPPSLSSNTCTSSGG